VTFLDKTRAAYDTIAVDYTVAFHDELEGAPIERAMMTAFADLVRAGAKERSGRGLVDAGSVGEGPVGRLHDRRDPDADDRHVRADLRREPVGGTALVGDIGCGAGICARFLTGLGMDVVGIDMSAGMLAQARASHPDLRLGQGSMTALPIATGALAGLLAMYSVIHIPDDALVGVLGEFRRVLVPGGQVMLAFQDLDEHLLRTEAFGHAIALDYYFRSPERMAAYLGDAGFEVHTRTQRAAFPGERTPRAMLLARRI
jgi:SAM-dependent methyltransferase